ncbi:ABC transporter substrate-binding protein [Bacillus sp. JJ722]|uniref:ABC transporter substrate-binding protein n=1 Tax=Bacillus sp. JJ722 TaxID=3122973 RepID=UPI003000A1BD
MKKIVSVLSAAALSLSLIACSNGEATDKDAGKEDKIKLTYANWNLNSEEEINIEKLMIKEFEKQNKNIDIVIDESQDPKDWNGSLAASASAGKLPDVFMMHNIPSSYGNDWLLDITEFTKNDKEWSTIAPSVREAVAINDKTYAVPFAQHMAGYFINKDLFNQENLDVPKYGWSIDEFTSSVKSLTNLQKNMIGLGNNDTIVDWYPNAASDQLGYYTYDGEKYNLNSKEFIEGVNLARDLSKNGMVYETLPAETKAQFDGEYQSDVFKAGQMGVFWDATWAITDFTDLASIDWDFVGVPGGKNIIINDYLGISATTKEKEAAYEFAKWMSFSKEGFMKRMDLAEENEKALSTLPISTDQEILDKYFANVDVPGLLEAYENIDKAVVEPVKSVPGYIESRWDATTGLKVGDKENATIGDIIFNSVQGDVKIEDYTNQLNELANKKHEEAKKSMQ